jgi:hypothetical protein
MLRIAAVAAAVTVSKHPGELRPHLLQRRIDPLTVRSYDEIYDWLDDQQLLLNPPKTWATDWTAANPDRFTI